MFDLSKLDETDALNLLGFALESMEIFDWARFNPDTDQCEWCLWAPHDTVEHYCSLTEVAEIVSRCSSED